MNVFRMAWRNVWRNKRRTLVTVTAMILALWVELIYAGLVPGFIADMERGVVELEIGDVQIHAPGFVDNPSIFTAMPDADALVRDLEAAGLPASARLLGGGLAASGDASAGVALTGIDPAQDARVSLLPQHVAEGTWLDPADPKGVVLGKRLAKTLNAHPGAEVVIVSQAADGSLANDLFTVRGVLGAVAQGTDRGAVLMNAAAFRELMSFPEGAHLILMRRGDLDLTAAKAKAVQVAAGQDVRSWKELLPVVAQMTEATASVVYIFFTIIYIAVGILILNAMLMAVFERIREFGVLKAIGMGPVQVLSLILIEAFYQIGIAMAVGCLLGAPAMYGMATHGINVAWLGGADVMGVAMGEVWHGIYTVESVAPPLVLLWVIAGGATLYPALKAAWIDPIRAMRYR
jgi:ABC-type lipoprotein release transport system permease subunit